MCLQERYFYYPDILSNCIILFCTLYSYDIQIFKWHWDFCLTPISYSPHSVPANAPYSTLYALTIFTSFSFDFITNHHPWSWLAEPFFLFFNFHWLSLLPLNSLLFCYCMTPAYCNTCLPMFSILRCILWAVSFAFSRFFFIPAYSILFCLVLTLSLVEYELSNQALSTQLCPSHSKSMQNPSETKYRSQKLKAWLLTTLSMQPLNNYILKAIIKLLKHISPIYHMASL